MKKLLIGCLIALIIGNLTGCTNKKVNNETNETNTTTDENTENQETNIISLTSSAPIPRINVTIAEQTNIEKINILFPLDWQYSSYSSFSLFSNL